MSETTARKAADYIIAVAHEAGDPISNLKLQKLLYYAQGWHLALKGEPLFDERIEAWVHGPVVPPVYGEFKGWAWKPIDYDPGQPAAIGLPNHVTAHLDEVMEVYGGMNALDLERLTHSEPPWLNARGTLAPDEPCTTIIRHEDMKAYFRSLADENTGR